MCVGVGSGVLGTAGMGRTPNPNLGRLVGGDAPPLAMPSYIVAATVRSSLSPGDGSAMPWGCPMTGFVMAAIVLIVVTAPLVQLIVGASQEHLGCRGELAIVLV